MKWRAASLDMPIWTFHGSDDVVINPIQTEEMVNELKRLNRDVKYTKIEGAGHGIQELAYIEDLLMWLLGKNR